MRQAIIIIVFTSTVILYFAGGQTVSGAGNLMDDPSMLLWGTYLGGGTTIEEGYAVAFDQVGNAVVAGYTNSPDFPVTAGAYDVTFGGSCDAFVAKVSASGDQLIWSTFVGGGGLDYGLSVAVDESGDVVVSGATQSTDFPTTSGAYDQVANGDYDGFIAKLSSDGTSLVWGTYLGGSASDWIYALALDASGNAIVGGRTFSVNFPTSPGAYDTTHGGKRDVFVTRVSSSGSVLLSSTFIGSSGSEWGYNLGLDADGNALVTGVTQSVDFPTTPGAYDRTFNGGTSDAFVAKVNPQADSLLWSTYLGGSVGQEEGQMVVVDGAGDVVVTGFTTSTDFPATPGAFDTSYNGSYDSFAAKISSAGDSLVWGTFLGGSGFERGYGLTVDESGNPILTGSTSSPDFPTTPAAYDTALGGGSGDDAFITVLASSGDTLVWSSYLGGTGIDRGYAVALDQWGNLGLTGPTYSTDFPTTPGAYDGTFNGGNSDVFVACLDIKGTSGVAAGYTNLAAPDLSGSVPNPFRSSTVLRFYLPESQYASASIYDVRGALIKSLLEGVLDSGAHQVAWDATTDRGAPAAPGVYLCRVQVAAGSSVKTVVLLK